MDRTGVARVDARATPVRRSRAPDRCTVRGSVSSGGAPMAHRLVVRPDRDAFDRLAADWPLVPVWAELLSDIATPVSAFPAVAGDGPGILLESVERSERWGRYSFVAGDPAAILVVDAAGLHLREVARELPTGEPSRRLTPREALRAAVHRLRAPRLEGLPPITGGLMGYAAYEAATLLDGHPVPHADEAPSPRVTFPAPDGGLPIYRRLRVSNPAPYMFYLRMLGMELAGSSPEPLVRVEGRRVTARPIAGTRPRGRSDASDRLLEHELLADPKERAEHAMLVDLARNDLGRVSEPGTVRPTELMQVERFTRVMHIVSTIEGDLRQDMEPFDALAVTFPAGTVTGAPKRRAMELIAEHEPDARGAYAGAVGYLTFAGDLDFCITIRTVVVTDGSASVQTGAGVVADSDPETELRETKAKASALIPAVAPGSTRGDGV